MRILIVAAALAALAASPAMNAAAAGKAVTVAKAWARPASQGGNAAGYLTITNAGSQPDVLLSVESPVAKASLHRSSMQGGVMSMREMSDGIPVPARQTVALAPGGDHIMLAGLSRPLLKGQKFPATLVFKRAGRVRIEISVETTPLNRLEDRKQ